MSWANQSKNISSPANQSKNSTTFDDGLDFALKEDTFFLLLESGFKIVLDQSPNARHTPAFANQVKN